MGTFNLAAILVLLDKSKLMSVPNFLPLPSLHIHHNTKHTYTHPLHLLLITDINFLQYDPPDYLKNMKYVKIFPLSAVKLDPKA